MRKLSEIKGEEALDVLADMLVPITAIANDEEVREGFNTNVATCASVALKKHKDDVIDMLAALDGRSREEMLEDIIFALDIICLIIQEKLKLKKFLKKIL